MQALPSGAAAPGPAAPHSAAPEPVRQDASANAPEASAALAAGSDAAASGAPSRDAAAALLDSGTPPPDASTTAPQPSLISEAYTVLGRGERVRMPAMVEALDTAARADRNHGYLAFYAGAFGLWQLSEPPDPLEVLLLPERAQRVVGHLQRAHDLLPGDFRIHAFLGLAQAMLSVLSANEADLETGLTTLEGAVAARPDYGLFLRATSVAALPTDHPRFALAVSDMTALMRACEVPADANGLTYTYPARPDPAHRTCFNEGIVPHVWEGIFLSFGDMALKAGWPPERARAIYRSAQSSPTYGQWPFAATLEQHMAEAEQRANAYSDPNPFNDPSPWGASGHICVGCHQR